MRTWSGLRSLLLAAMLAFGAALAACPPKHAPDELMDAVLRRAILSRVWETVDEHYLYHDFGGRSWPQELTHYRTEVGLVADNEAFYTTVDTMIFGLGDDHSIYLAPWEACAEDRYYAAPPVPQAEGLEAVPAPTARRLETDPDIVHLQLPSFDSLAIPELVEQLLADSLSQGQLGGIVLDLRQNYGGFLDTAYEVLGMFVAGYVGNEYDDLGEYPISLRGGRLADPLAGLPIAVLVDQGTTSAAEIVAAVLQQQGRAVIVGQPTPGNTETVAQFDFVDGSRLWLAVGGFRLPDGASLEGRGVQPDVTLAAGPAGDDRALAAAVAALNAR